ncbi:hypothetical protein LUZ63_021155 [Rhynchospora breviuscula]|uniref:3-methyl-2-oxobutanoate hydroxymethyltransferase n=1 Tax=Rhynchospora breviuscula TaxID=2022672 RepID=A0A9P9Z775_9POAL|nr:hypothetical protein LUZ63_021155 [Rhynchospora breviuscula]
MTGPKVTLRRLRELADAGTPIVMVTAYDFVSGRVAERAGVDMVLVGDSGAQVVLGLPDTTSVTLDEMLMLAKAVRRAVHTPLIVCDLPFGTTELSDAQAVATSVRFVAGGRRRRGQDRGRQPGGAAVAAPGDRGCRHPRRGPRRPHPRRRPRPSADSVAAGAAPPTTRSGWHATRSRHRMPERSRSSSKPSPRMSSRRSGERFASRSIGIGAGPADGQVLVQHDLLGITEGRPPVFVKRYGALGDAMVDAVEAYAREVREGDFPAAEHVYPAFRRRGGGGARVHRRAGTRRGNLDALPQHRQALALPRARRSRPASAPNRRPPGNRGMFATRLIHRHQPVRRGRLGDRGAVLVRNDRGELERRAATDDHGSVHFVEAKVCDLASVLFAVAQIDDQDSALLNASRMVRRVDAPRPKTCGLDDTAIASARRGRSTV